MQLRENDGSRLFNTSIDRGVSLGAQAKTSRRALLVNGALLAAWVLIDSRNRSAALELVEPASSQGSPLLEDLVAANRILVNHGVLDTLGHVSVRNNRTPNRYLMSRSRAPKLVESGDIEEYELDSRPVRAREHQMYLERFIHGAIYEARPDVHAVVHNHAESLIPFGVTQVPLRPVFQSAAFISAGVPVFEIREAAGVSDLLIKNEALGRALAAKLADRNAVLMRGHGAVVVGPSLPMVVRRSINLALNARLQLEAIALGGDINYLDPEEAKEIMKREDAGLDRSWELWKREAMNPR
jgi:HCOMODA/2-hydroxy-3-carboxy-muconic semialdehyde decarboxylase